MGVPARLIEAAAAKHEIAIRASRELRKSHGGNEPTARSGSGEPLGHKSQADERVIGVPGAQATLGQLKEARNELVRRIQTDPRSSDTFAAALIAVDHGIAQLSKSEPTPRTRPSQPPKKPGRPRRRAGLGGVGPGSESGGAADVRSDLP